MIRYFSSESVSVGHPDKVCDAISNAIVDEFMKLDPESRVAIEVMVTTGLVFITGEVRSTAYVDVEKVARDTIEWIGYDRSELGFDYKSCGIILSINKQSDEIAQGVDDIDGDEGAGDQGIIFGYAEVGNKYYLSPANAFASVLMRKQRDYLLKGLRPDAKSQVTIAEDTETGKKWIHSIVLALSHDPEVNREALQEVARELINNTAKELGMESYVTSSTSVILNNTGSFVKCGPAADAGVTGRKLAVDSYGGSSRLGGGNINGKDCTKVDKSAAYITRYYAKNLVAAGIADKVEIQVAYAIGSRRPESVFVDTFGTNRTKYSDEEIADKLAEQDRFSPSAAIRKLQLRKTITLPQSNGGIMGHYSYSNADGWQYFPWEILDSVEELRQMFF